MSNYPVAGSFGAVGASSSGGSSAADYVLGTYSGTDSYAVGYESASTTKYYIKRSITASSSGSSISITEQRAPSDFTVELGFKPSYLIIDDKLFNSAGATETIYLAYYDNVNNGGYPSSPNSSTTQAVRKVGFTDTGFKVALKYNRTGVHNYIAFK